MSAAISLAFGAGLLATVNPCGFALLPSFLSFYLGADDGDETTSALARTREGFTVGLVLSGAFSGVFIITGLIVTAGLRSVLDALPWVALAVGVALVALGGAMVAGRRVSLLAAGRLRPDVERHTGYSRVAAFGVGYALASLSCTLAVFLVVVGQALTVSGIVQTLAVFGAYAAGSASVLLALSVCAALAKGTLARVVRRFAPVANRLAGALLVLSGVYLAAYWLPALGSGSPNSQGEVATRTGRISAALADFFADHTTVFVAALGSMLALGVALAIHRHLGHRALSRADRSST